MALKNFSMTPADNQIGNVPEKCPEGWAFSSVNGWGASLMADVRSLAASNTIASAATCDLGSLNETFLTITGTTTITGFGTVSDGIYKFVTFSGALTLTHNATSLILLTGANRTTVAGDCGLYKSEGSGNWREYFYSAQGGYQPLDAQLTTLAGITADGATRLTTLAGITAQQATDLAAVSTFIGTLLNDADAATARATLGVESKRLLQNLNVTTGALATGTTLIPQDDTIPQITEGDQYMELAITPTSTTSLLEVTVTWFGSHNALSGIAVALFRDAVADALAVTQAYNEANHRDTQTFSYRMTSGTTSEIIFRVRAGGGDTGTTTFNGSAGARLYGGQAASSITIKEYAA